jgi:hypothetical protein
MAQNGLWLILLLAINALVNINCLWALLNSKLLQTNKIIRSIGLLEYNWKNTYVLLSCTDINLFNASYNVSSFLIDHLSW